MPNVNAAQLPALSASLSQDWLDLPAFRSGGALNGSAEAAAWLRSVILDISGMESAAYSPTARFQEDLGMDSLDMVELVMICEKDLLVSIHDRDWVLLKTAGEFEQMLIGKLEALAQG